jgi:hypothetical protein
MRSTQARGAGGASTRQSAFRRPLRSAQLGRPAADPLSRLGICGYWVGPVLSPAPGELQALARAIARFRRPSSHF